jgi:hypothetical protein
MTVVCDDTLRYVGLGMMLGMMITPLILYVGIKLGTLIAKL